MMNNVENKNDLSKMSDLEFGKNKVEMMRYRENSLSYKLGMGGIACSVLAAFFCLNAFNPINFTTLVAIMLNIVVLLGGFLCVEKARSYSMNGSIALMVFGGVCIARIFWIPLLLIIHYNGWIADKKKLAEWIANNDGVIPVEGAENYVEYAAYTKKVSSHLDYIGKTITTDNYNKLTYLPTDGNIRGILAIISLVAAAAFLIAAGYIGMVRSKRLNTYLSSINQKKVGGN